MQELENRLRSELNKVENWMIATKLTLNALKSNIIIINSKQNSPTVKMSISCKTGRIKSVQSAKYLGVLIDEKLNFKDQLTKIQF